MGYFVSYTLEIRVMSQHLEQALDIFNGLHEDEMLEKYANGRSWGPDIDKLPVKKRKWYSWVKNPDKPYTTLEEAFSNWGIVDSDIRMYTDINGDFIISGSYGHKLGQQDFLIEKLAPVIADVEIEYIGEDGFVEVWCVKDHKFSVSAVSSENKN